MKNINQKKKKKSILKGGVEDVTEVSELVIIVLAITMIVVLIR